MDFTPGQIHAFRYWIQGYPNFYEPIAMEWFKVAGYRVIRRPAKVEGADIQKIIDALFDGRRKLGRELNVDALIACPSAYRKLPSAPGYQWTIKS